MGFLVDSVSICKELRFVMIEVRNLSKTFRVRTKKNGLCGFMESVVKPEYRNVKAVDDISFSVEKGEIIGFIGPNGAGKSTTIKMLTNILYPDNGYIRVIGMDPAKNRKELAYKIGTMFGQKEQLWMHLTPYDNFRFFGSIYDIDEVTLSERIGELSCVFDLNDFMNTPVKNLSLGQRIRCEIVASLIHNPEILFLDEPTIGLDPVVKEKIRFLIKNLNNKYKTTIFLTSHDIGDIEKLCKRIIIINNGRIVVDDKTENLKHEYLFKKNLEIIVKEKVDAPSAAGVSVLGNNDFALNLQVDTNKVSVSDVIKMLDYDKIVDINISNGSLEDIISDIYKGEKSQ